MTRQEAIDTINTSPLFWFRATDKEREALWTALGALEEPSSVEYKIFADGMPLEEYLVREWKKQRAYLEEHGIIFRDGGAE